MAKVYALIEFIDTDGVKHEVDGQEIDLPRNTDAEKATFDRLIDYGVVTRSEVKANPPAAEESEPPQRTPRRKS